MGHQSGRHTPKIPRTPDMSNLQRNIAQMFQRGESGRLSSGLVVGSGEPSATPAENGDQPYDVETQFAQEQHLIPDNPKSTVAQHNFQDHQLPSSSRQSQQHKKHQQYVRQQSQAQQEQHPSRQSAPITHHSSHQPNPAGPINPQSSLAQTPVDIPVMYMTDRSTRNLRIGADKTLTTSSSSVSSSAMADLSSRVAAVDLASHNSSDKMLSPEPPKLTPKKVTEDSTDTPLQTNAAYNEEDNWKNAWDDDDESSGDENGHDEEPGPLITAPSLVVTQPFRANMDGQHSVPSSIKQQPLAIGNGYHLHQSNHQYNGSSSLHLPQEQPKLTTIRNKSSTSNHAVVHGTTADADESEEDVLTKEADKALREGENGIKWDTTASVAGSGADLGEKPSVRMFFPLLRVLGKGSFGKVVLVQKRTGKERGGLFAMKILRKAHLVKRRQIERTKTERKVLSMVDHPFIMKLHFAFQTEDKLFLVLDYCPGGELFFHLSRYRRFPDRVTRFYAAELLLAIGHLHKKGIIYRDMKPENVLLDADGHVKLGDFGLAKDRIDHPYMGATSMCGTPEYMAPEVLGQTGHGFCVDYWGLGMIAYEMMTGLPPWYTTDRAKLFKRLKSAPLEIPHHFSQRSAKYVSALLERNPRKRLGVLGLQSALNHEYFREINFTKLRARQIEAPIRPCEGWNPPEPSRSDRDVDTAESLAGGISLPSTGPSVSLTDNGTKSGVSQVEKMTTDALDAATANFDNTFTRMPVNTEENVAEPQGSPGSEELNENTFVGFTFDEKDTTRPQRNLRSKMPNGTVSSAAIVTDSHIPSKTNSNRQTKR